MTEVEFGQFGGIVGFNLIKKIKFEEVDSDLWNKFVEAVDLDNVKDGDTINLNQQSDGVCDGMSYMVKFKNRTFMCSSPGNGNGNAEGIVHMIALVSKHIYDK